MKAPRARWILIAVVVAGCDSTARPKDQEAAAGTGTGTSTSTSTSTGAGTGTGSGTGSAAVAPSGEGLSVCERYAELETRCGGYTGDAAKQTLVVARDYCIKARAGEEEGVMAALIKLESECAATETECEAYAACVEKAKDEHDPPGM